MSTIKIPEAFISATQETLSCFVGMAVETSNIELEQDSLEYLDVSATITITGEKEGVLLFSFTEPCALAITQALLGDSTGNPLNDAKDVIGEIVNIISGRARAILSEQGLLLQGSTPSAGIEKYSSIFDIVRKPTKSIPFTSEYGDFFLKYILV